MQETAVDTSSRLPKGDFDASHNLSPLRTAWQGLVARLMMAVEARDPLHDSPVEGAPIRGRRPSQSQRTETAEIMNPFLAAAAEPRRLRSARSSTAEP